MSRLLLAFAGIVLLVVTALGVLWLAGEVLVGAGLLAVGTAGVLLRLLWFLVLAAALGGAVYFVASAWRPGATPTPKAGAGQARSAVTVLTVKPQVIAPPDALMGQD